MNIMKGQLVKLRVEDKNDDKNKAEMQPKLHQQQTRWKSKYA